MRKEKISGIYLIFCRASKKKYIGSAVDIPKRFRRHTYDLITNKHHNPYLQRAWNKYQQNNFKFSIIEYCCPDKLLEREQFWLDILKTYDETKGFNIHKSANSPLGLKRSDEARKRMSEAGKRRAPMSEETKRKIGAASKGNQYNKGRFPSQETRQKMSKASKGHKRRVGYKTSEATKAKLSIAFKGHKRNLGRKHSEETRQKMRESSRKRWDKYHKEKNNE
jgi:group I intron endonuclease